MKVFDLSMELSEKTPYHPGTKKPVITQVATIAKKGWNEKRLNVSSHFSTHIDAPFHMLPNGKKLGDFPVGYFIGEAIVINVKGQEFISPNLDAVRENDIVFFYTGVTEKISSAMFKKFPVLTEKTARKLVEKKVKIIGLDSWTPDAEPYEIHKILMKHDILIVEDLVNLKPLVGKRFECVILPLKIKDADGAPCRVIARL